MSLPLRVLSNLIRPRIQHLILHVTDRCNLRCKHCFVDLTQRHTLSVEDAHRIAGTVGDLLWLDIGGGEPFLLKELPELIAPFDCEVLGIPTNGHDPDGIARRVAAILETARAREIVISVSIEGFREEHNRIRVNPRSFDRAFESLRVLRGIADENPRLRIKCNTVITNGNVDRLVEFMRFMRASRLLDFHSVILLRGDTHATGIGLPPLDRLRALQKELFSILEGYQWGSGPLKRSLLRRYYGFLWDVSLRTLECGRQVIPCIAGRAHLVIWANGDVASCELLPAVGNLNKKPLAEILAGEPLRQQVDGIRRRQCACTHNCAMLDSILLNPLNYPRMLAGWPTSSGGGGRDDRGAIVA